jgi:transposase-like protein
MSVEYVPCDGRCIKCNTKELTVRTVESSDGAFEDYQYKCEACGYTWWVDGIDS